MKLAPLTVLSDEEIRQIHEATLDLLEDCGVEVTHPRMLDLLRSKGLTVDLDRGIIRFPRACLEEALARVPDQFEVFDRDGRPAFVLGDGTPRIAAGHNAVFWVDTESGATRPSAVGDVEQFACLCNHLPNIDMIGIPVMPQDVQDPRSTLLHAVRAVARHSAKPLFFSTDMAAVNRTIIDMMLAIFPGDLTHQVYGISQLSPTSPLYWESSVLDAILDTIETGVPLAILPEPNAGVSAPYTLAGLLAVNNAECLSGLAMIQLLKPGHKVLYANSWTTTDMRTGAALVGSIETSICRIAGAQLARFYRVPSHTTAPNSDNHAHDEQNAWEKTFSLLCAVGGGNDLIVNCGMFATGLTFSHEQLLMDEEIAGMTRRLIRGVRVTPETIAKDLVAGVGPHGNGYLMADHTIAHLRGDEYFLPYLAVRGPRGSWENSGSKDTYELAKDRVRELAVKPGSRLDPAREEKLTDILHGFHL